METPDHYYSYFRSGVDFDPTNMCWRAGLTAATLWQEISNAPTPDDLSKWNILIEQLLPCRWAGSGFHAFWLTILRHIRILPPTLQVPLFIAIFNSNNQGDQLIKYSEQAHPIIQQWHAMIDITVLDIATCNNLVTLTYPYFGMSIEWYTLVLVIDQWIKTMLPTYNFMQELVSLYFHRKSS